MTVETPPLRRALVRRRRPAMAGLTAALALGLVALTGSCSAAKPSAHASSARPAAPATATFTDSGVTVTLRL
ncbi:MAG TPA: hypothetical protein VGL02_28580, partial [Streptomyces sp.]